MTPQRLFKECSKLAGEFVMIVSEHCPREKNEIADELANKAHQDQSIWIDSLATFYQSYSKKH